MNVKPWILPGFACGLLVFSARHMVVAATERPRPEPPRAPPGAPASAAAERHGIAGLGIVEPAGEAIRLGSHRAGVVAKLLVATGDKVKAGATLLCLDERAAQSDVRVREADVAAASAELARLQHLPRPSAVAPLRSRLAAAEARLRQVGDRSARTQSLVNRSAAPAEEAVQAEASTVEAERERDAAKDELALAAEGAWAPDLAVAKARVERALTILDQARTELDLHCLKAPVDAVVLKVGVRAGEFVGAGGEGAGIVLGRDLPWQLRVDFDEGDIERFKSATVASAAFRDARGGPVRLKLLSVEPVVAPKRVFSGASLERVDTRVLQAIYSLESQPSAAVYVGQQVDVFAE